jgi:hypothetical protein
VVHCVARAAALQQCDAGSKAALELWGRWAEACACTEQRRRGRARGTEKYIYLQKYGSNSLEILRIDCASCQTDGNVTCGMVVMMGHERDDRGRRTHRVTDSQSNASPRNMPI